MSTAEKRREDMQNKLKREGDDHGGIWVVMID